MTNQKEEKILEFVRLKGPVVPIQVSKEFGIESFLASAILSSLKNSKKIYQSFKKVGSSPLYYTPEQQEKVRKMLYEELKNLEKKALERLKEMKVAFKDDLYPQERVLLSELQDFVSYLKIDKDGEEIFCWKHHSVSDEEFDSILKKKIGESEEKVDDMKQKEFEPKEEIKEDVEKIEDSIEKTSEVPKDEVETKKVDSVQEEPREKEVMENQGFEQEKTSVEEEKNKNGIEQEKREKEVEEKQSELNVEKEVEAETDFEQKVINFLKEKNVKILDKEKKRSDTNFIVIAQNVFGEQKYFVKAKDKKSVNKGDVSKCYIESLSKKYPVILIVPKKLRKSVKEYVKTHFKGLITVIVVK